MALLPCVEVAPPGRAEASVIWLHGLGADGHDFEPVVPALRLPADLKVRFVFPHAPQMPVTLNNGMRMPAWYDILDLSLERRVDETSLRASARAVGELITREVERGVPTRRIVLAGFSQGGAVGYELALTWPEPLGGLLAMSTYFATRRSIEPHAANAGLPIAIQHGDADPLVAESHGREAAELLTEWGYAVDYRTYPMEHAVCPAQIRDIGSWLTARLAP